MYIFFGNFKGDEKNDNLIHNRLFLKNVYKNNDMQNYFKSKYLDYYYSDFCIKEINVEK